MLRTVVAATVVPVTVVAASVPPGGAAIARPGGSGLPTRGPAPGRSATSGSTGFAGLWPEQPRYSGDPGCCRGAPGSTSRAGARRFRRAAIWRWTTTLGDERHELSAWCSALARIAVRPTRCASSSRPPGRQWCASSIARAAGDARAVGTVASRPGLRACGSPRRRRSAGMCRERCRGPGRYRW